MLESLEVVSEKPASDAFAERTLQIVNDAALALMLSIGHRTRLFDVLATRSSWTSVDLAEAAGLSERYVREWLGAMVTGRIVDLDVRTQRYSLPVDHAACLTRAASPNNLAVTMQWVAVLGTAEDAVVEAFTHGRGVPYSAYPRFHEVMAEESQQTVVDGLVPHILPLVPELVNRLEGGIGVLDIACGSGRAMLALAQAFPRSYFTGIDMSADAVAAAEAQASRQALPNVRFLRGDAAELAAVNQYELVTAFDAIHDQAKPAQVLGRIHTALRPGGVLLMQDILGHTQLADNLSHPLAPFLYTISCLHCMSVSLAAGGPGLGAMWGRERAVSMLREAGFDDVRVETLPHDPLNYYYIAAKSR
jgi:2-polyprenyl-3-methyl-5-hydroxy-6-metoxy-1,4-benzoquinol methylase